MFKRLSLAVAMSTVAAVPAFAHLDPLEHGSIAAGLSHPLFGADHVLAMVAVGLWAAQIATDPNRRQALWLVPAAFVAMMVLGFGLAVAGAPLPFVEPAILASVMASAFWWPWLCACPSPHLPLSSAYSRSSMVTRMVVNWGPQRHFSSAWALRSQRPSCTSSASGWA